MNQNPLTDPTSLITYRLAHGEPSPHETPATDGGSRKTSVGSVGSAAVFALGLFLIALAVLAFI
jgi:hypothetical protein